MVTVHREAGLRIVIYTDDHEPAHVHVFGDGHCKINLAGPDGGPRLVFADGVNTGELRRAMRVVASNRTALLERWRIMHG